MDILNLVVPLVGVVGAFLLALAAIKQRTLLGFFGRGLDETKALSALPARAKLEGLEIIENTLESVWKIRDERFGVVGFHPWRRGSSPVRRRCAFRSRGPDGAIGSSIRRCVRRPSGAEAP